MGLKSIKTPTAEVEVPGSESFAVRGLSFVDLRVLYVKYASEVSAFFNMLASGQNGGAFDVENAVVLIADFIDKAPALAAEVIAIASGEEDAFAEALALPFPVQIEALKKIGVLTFGSEDTGKKFLMTVNKLVANQKEKLVSR